MDSSENDSGALCASGTPLASSMINGHSVYLRTVLVIVIRTANNDLFVILPICFMVSEGN